MTTKVISLSPGAKNLIRYIFDSPFLPGIFSAVITIIFSVLLGYILISETTASGNETYFRTTMGALELTVIVPLIETLVFQTLVIVVTSKITQSKAINIFLSSAVFSAAHVSNVESWSVIFEGIILALIPGVIFAHISFKNIIEKQIKKSIIYTWAAHSTHNVLVLVVYSCLVLKF